MPGDLTPGPAPALQPAAAAAVDEPRRSPLLAAWVRFVYTLQMAVTGVLSQPLRSGLTALSVVIGVVTVVSLIGIGEGARRSVVAQFASLGENVIIIETLDDRFQFEPGLAEELVERVSELAYATPVVETEAAVRWRRERGNLAVLGVNEQFPLIRDHQLAAGTFFSDLHVRQRSRVVVLGYNVAARLLGGRSPVGQTMTVEGRTFRIIGVLNPKGTGQAGGIDDMIVVPYTVAQQISGVRNVRQIWAKADSPEQADLAVARLGRIFRREVGLSPVTGGGGEKPENPDEAGGVAPPRSTTGSRLGSAEELVAVTSLNQMVKEADRANRVMTVMLGGIAAVSLLVGGIGIMNIMLVSVSERTSEIGLRKALGARRTDLLTQFLAEAFMLSVAGGAAGLVLALISRDVLGAFGLQAVITPQSALISLGLAVAVGIVFGVYPAWTASDLPPAEALRRK